MTGWSLPHQDGVVEAVNLLKGKCTIPVLAALALDERQNKDILATVNRRTMVSGSDRRNLLSPRVLADTLQRATDDELIEQDVEGGTFGVVRYRLTSKSRNCCEPSSRSLRGR